MSRVNQSPSPENKSIGDTLLDLFEIISKRRRFFVWFVVIVTLGAVVLALFTPKQYKAMATVVPAKSPEYLSMLSGISGLLGSTSALSRIAPGIGGPTELERYEGILTSESALMSVITQFNLTNVYEITRYPREKTMKELLSNLNLEATYEGNLRIEVFDEDPQRAVEIATYLIKVLNDINTDLHIQNARGSRGFIEERYKQNLVELDAAQDSLRVFQERFRVLALPEQLEASIKAGAEIYATMYQAEIELDIARRTLGEENPSVQSRQIQVDEMKRKWRQLNLEGTTDKEEMNVIIPFKKAPQLGAAYIRLYRDVEIQYRILQFLAPLYEQAKVEENRNIPSVVVLDYPALPERKARPKISLYGLLGLVISIVVGLFIVFALEGVDRLRRAHPARYQGVIDTFRKDWFGLRLRRGRR
jgi:tyrosine-protein kinase Etk/Wzc